MLKKLCGVLMILLGAGFLGLAICKGVVDFDGVKHHDEPNRPLERAKVH